MTTHNPKSIFNTDLCGGLFHIVLKMLVDSQPGWVELLPAPPPKWPTGTIEGARCRGQIEVRRLTWDASKITAMRQSAVKQDVTLKAPGGYSRLVGLPAGRDVTVEIAQKPE